MSNDKNDEYLENCRKCGGSYICQMEADALFIGGHEYWVMCFECGAAGESSHDFGTEADAEECRFVARDFWNAHGWTTMRPSVIALFSRGDK